MYKKSHHSYFVYVVLTLVWLFRASQGQSHLQPLFFHEKVWWYGGKLVVVPYQHSSGKHPLLSDFINKVMMMHLSSLAFALPIIHSPSAMDLPSTTTTTLLASSTASVVSPLFRNSLALSSTLTTMVFGQMLLFCTVIMPGIGILEDAAFLRAFQVMDHRIQQNEPFFTITWVGSILSTLMTAWKGWQDFTANAVVNATIITSPTVSLSSLPRVGLLVATVLYMAGQVITFTQNIPLNNRVKGLDLSSSNIAQQRKWAQERSLFETKWNRWNLIRTVLFGVASSLYTVLLLSLGSGSGAI